MMLTFYTFILAGFTRIDDPYELPLNSEITETLKVLYWWAAKLPAETYSQEEVSRDIQSEPAVTNPLTDELQLLEEHQKLLDLTKISGQNNLTIASLKFTCRILKDVSGQC